MKRFITVLAAAALLVGGASLANAASTPTKIRACVATKEIKIGHAYLAPGTTRITSRPCRSGEKVVTWNVQGVAGPRGATGPQGPSGTVDPDPEPTEPSLGHKENQSDFGVLGEPDGIFTHPQGTAKDGSTITVERFIINISQGTIGWQNHHCTATLYVGDEIVSEVTDQGGKTSTPVTADGDQPVRMDIECNDPKAAGDYIVGYSYTG